MRIQLTARGNHAPGLVSLLLVLLAWQFTPSAALTRHRHRREPFPLAEPQYFEGQITKRLKDEQRSNEYKPKFHDCERYTPEVEEESPRGKTRLSYDSFEIGLGLFCVGRCMLCHGMSSAENDQFLPFESEADSEF